MKMREKYERILEEFVEKCKERFGSNLVSVVLFGSVARDSPNQRSDVDVLIVIDSEKGGKKRFDLLKDLRLDFLIKYGVRLETLLLTKKETIDNFNNFSPLFSSFILGIKILFDKNFFGHLFKKFLRAVQTTEIKYYEGGKIWDLQKISSKTLQ